MLKHMPGIKIQEVTDCSQIDATLKTQMAKLLFDGLMFHSQMPTELNKLPTDMIEVQLDREYAAHPLFQTLQACAGQQYQEKGPVASILMQVIDTMNDLSKGGARCLLAYRDDALVGFLQSHSASLQKGLPANQIAACCSLERCLDIEGALLRDFILRQNDSSWFTVVVRHFDWKSTFLMPHESSQPLTHNDLLALGFNPATGSQVCGAKCCATSDLKAKLAQQGQSMTPMFDRHQKAPSVIFAPYLQQYLDEAKDIPFKFSRK